MRQMLNVIAGAVFMATGAYAADAVIAPEDVEYGEYGAVAESLTGQPGNVENGIEVMTTRGLGNCIACHQVTALQSAEFHGEVGPSLDGAADRWTEADLRGIVADAKMVFPESMMPSFYKTSGYTRPGVAFTAKPADGPLPPLLTAQEIEDVVAFMMTLHDN